MSISFFGILKNCAQVLKNLLVGEGKGLLLDSP